MKAPTSSSILPPNQEDRRRTGERFDARGWFMETERKSRAVLKALLLAETFAGTKPAA